MVNAFKKRMMPWHSAHRSIKLLEHAMKVLERVIEGREKDCENL